MTAEELFDLLTLDNFAVENVLLYEPIQFEISDEIELE